MCKVNTSIMVDAKRFGISSYQLDRLHEEYHRINGGSPPTNFIQLLKVVE